MSFDHLTVRERNHVQRAYSQAVYYAQRGFYDACRINVPEIPPDLRSRLTGVVGQFLNAYIISELGYLVAGGESEGDGLTRIAPLMSEPILACENSRSAELVNAERAYVLATIANLKE